MKKCHTAKHYAVALFLLLTGTYVSAQHFDVTAQIRLLPLTPETTTHASDDVHNSPRRSVVWLTPIDESARDQRPPRAQEIYTLVQKNKQFSPHLLIVPVGSMVVFPNQDPFFHNVFSMFNGRRFDLGLYETGSTRGVRFSREGISYIFCNIHPEMSAVVLTLSTPFFSIAGSHNTAVISDVPAGQYRLHVWSEGAELELLDALTRVVRIAANNTNLGTIDIPQQTDLNARHKNKFGKDYDTTPAPLY